MVNQPQEFVKRVEIECGKLGYDLWFGLVDYFEDDYTGEINVFKKRNKYKYQNEARFYIPNLDNKPIILQVGSIEDIANIIHFEQSDITKEELEKIR